MAIATTLPRSPRPTSVIEPDELRAWRLDAGLTQRELARRLGYSSSTICCMEHGRVRISWAIYDQLEKVLEPACADRQAVAELTARAKANGCRTVVRH